MVPTAVRRAMIVVRVRKQPRKDRPNVLLAISVGRRKKAVPNVLRVARVRLASGVKIVLKVLPEKGMTTTLPNANTVKRVKQQR